MYPYKNIGRRGEVVFPNNCIAVSKDLFYQGKYLTEKISLTCSKSLKGSFLEIVNLSVLTDALITKWAGLNSCELIWEILKRKKMKKIFFIKFVNLDLYKFYILI